MVMRQSRIREPKGYAAEGVTKARVMPAFGTGSRRLRPCHGGCPEAPPTILPLSRVSRDPWQHSKTPYTGRILGSHPTSRCAGAAEVGMSGDGVGANAARSGAS